ncbi:major facilitator superfamily transporter [Colletotrichum tofieldiae]|nr:major facilitator superfamily transporter [Colletotrichum tofieldiae]
MASERPVDRPLPAAGDGDIDTPARPEADEKRITDIVSYPSEDSDEFQDFPWRWKLTALVCGVALSWGSSFSENTLGPLKSTMIKQLDINNSQVSIRHDTVTIVGIRRPKANLPKYGAISSATSLVNTILPIVGGHGLDHYGVEWGSMACSIAIFVGAVVSAAGSNNDSFTLVVTGRVIMGFGSTVIETCTSKHKGLGLVYGLDLSIGTSLVTNFGKFKMKELTFPPCLGKLIVLIAKATAVPMRDATSFWGWALWIPAIVCFTNLLQNILYVWWARSRPTWTHMPTGQRLAREESQRERPRGESSETPTVNTRESTRRFGALPDWGSLVRVPRFFWLVACTQILQAGVVGGFNGLNADIITKTRGSTAELAGYTSAVQQVIPVICAPLIGTFFDFFGYRMMFVSLTSTIWILVYCLIGFTQTNALGAMVIASVASTMNALPFLASIPLIVPNQLELGLVFGIWKAFNNSGSVIVDMIAGRLQDITPGGTYERVIVFFVAVKGLEFCLGLFYGILDRK